MKYIFIIVITCLITGCMTLKQNESWENLLNYAKRPITVLSIYNKNDMTYVLFKDAKGKLFTIYGYQFYSFKQGDILY